jgi:glucosamine-6-phosphate deaminase
MSIRQILAAREILVIVPEQRKAAAVAAVLTGPITPAVPASILREHANATLYLDAASASLTDPKALSGAP